MKDIRQLHDADKLILVGVAHFYRIFCILHGGSIKDACEILPRLALIADTAQRMGNVEGQLDVIHAVEQASEVMATWAHKMREELEAKNENP